MIAALSRDIAASTGSEKTGCSDSGRIATDLMAIILGWQQLQLIGPGFSQREAIAYGDHAVNLMLAARAAW